MTWHKRIDSREAAYRIEGFQGSSFTEWKKRKRRNYEGVHDLAIATWRGRFCEYAKRWRLSYNEEFGRRNAAMKWICTKERSPSSSFKFLSLQKKKREEDDMAEGKEWSEESTICWRGKNLLQQLSKPDENNWSSWRQGRSVRDDLNDGDIKGKKHLGDMNEEKIREREILQTATQLTRL